MSAPLNVIKVQLDGLGYRVRTRKQRRYILPYLVPLASKVAGQALPVRRSDGYATGIDRAIIMVRFFLNHNYRLPCLYLNKLSLLASVCHWYLHAMSILLA